MTKEIIVCKVRRGRYYVNATEPVEVTLTEIATDTYAVVFNGRPGGEVFLESGGWNYRSALFGRRGVGGFWTREVAANVLVAQEHDRRRLTDAYTHPK